LEVEEENSFFFVGGQFVWQSATTCQEHERIKKRQVPFFSSMTHFLFPSIRNRKESNLKNHLNNFKIGRYRHAIQKQKRIKSLFVLRKESLYSPFKVGPEISIGKNKESNEMEG
jgi:hypothetical protein